MTSLPPSRWRWAWWLLAWFSLVLALLGAVLPVLPTVPFVLLAAYASARGSDRVRRWLPVHRLFGPLIAAWALPGAVSRRAKWLASTMMVAAGLLVFFTAPLPWVAWLVWLTMATVATWLWRRPEP